MAGRPRHSPCAELPNDNGALHEGTRWMPRDPLSQPRAWLLPSTGSETVWWPVRPTGLTPEPPQRVDALLVPDEAPPAALIEPRTDLPAVIVMETDGVTDDDAATSEPFELFDDLWVALAEPFHTAEAESLPEAPRAFRRRGWGRSLAREPACADHAGTPLGTLAETLVAAVVEDEFFEFVAMAEPLLALSAALDATIPDIAETEIVTESDVRAVAQVALEAEARASEEPVAPSDVRVVAAIAAVAEAPQPASGVPAGTPVAPGVAPDGFMAFVRALTTVALERGATRAALGIERLLCRGDVEAADTTFTAVMVEAGLLDAATGRATEALSTQTAAWRAVLRGESDDLSACGDGTLDQFACTLLRAALGLESGQTATLRRELRRRGVAAFGMLDLAA